jgi:protein O-GlcNAc transferase
MDENLLSSMLSAWPDCADAFKGVSIPLANSIKSLRAGRVFPFESFLVVSEVRAECGSDFYRFLRLISLLINAQPLRFLAEADSSGFLEPEGLWSRIINAQVLILKGDIKALICKPASFWVEPSVCELLQNVRIAAFLAVGQLDDALGMLGETDSFLSLERVRFKARYYARQGNYLAALKLLSEAAERVPSHLPLRLQLCDLVFENRDSERAIPTLRAALNEFGEHPGLLPFVARAKLHNREPSLAARAKLSERCWLSIEKRRTKQDGNLLSAYDHLGRSDWLMYLPQSWHQDKVSSLDLQANLVMQLASVQDPDYERHTAQLVESLRCHHLFDRHINVDPPPRSLSASVLDGSHSLDVIWITGDIANHPVCRFLLGFFQSRKNSIRHRHRIASLQPPARKFLEYFTNNVGVEVIDLSGLHAEAKTAGLRCLQADVAVDLSGWTGGNHVTGWMARIAPVQVNYLGYFASTGIRETDFWLGDEWLFPEPMQEWHAETVMRLPRCFIAWQPPSCLVEAGVNVSAPPQDPAIRFGCFNHFRKVSDACLAAWAQILRLVPEARLVLKGTTAFDQGSQELTRRRLLRQGIEPNRIDWLTLTPTPQEHLEQYSQMDVALDCFPNSGCTTTCEALWMGVPVVTLLGRGYVSRMSAAVMAGAGLESWIATDVDGYVALAVAQADHLRELRANRSQWRERLKASPLGDAADLFTHLEAAFSQMAAQVRAGSLAS